MRALLVVCGVAVALAACDQLPRFDRAPATVEREDAGLTLALDVPDVFDWGEVSTIRMTVANEGGAPSRPVRVELFLPVWLEFSSVEPVGTEVAMMSSADEMRLAYAIADPPLASGESRTIVQRVRVPPRTVGLARPTTDTVVDSPLVPHERVLRARLVAPDGRVLGTEMRTTLPFRGAAFPPAPPVQIPPPPEPRDTLPLRPPVPPVAPTDTLPPAG
jgi:hypothetical protein